MHGNVRLNLKSDVSKDELESIKVDVNKLSDREKDRFDWIEKINKEADEFALGAGIQSSTVNDSEEANSIVIERSIQETKWSGQSDVELTIPSSNNFDDLWSRKSLVIGDVIAFITFAVIGRKNHDEAIDFIDVLSTAAPFVISWVALSSFLGAYNRDATSSIGNVPKSLLSSWGVCVPLALVIRGFIKGYVPPTPFIIVTLISTYVLLLLWRALYITAVGETSDNEYKQAGFLEVFKMIGTLIRRW